MSINNLSWHWKRGDLIQPQLWGPLLRTTTTKNKFVTISNVAFGKKKTQVQIKTEEEAVALKGYKCEPSPGRAEIKSISLCPRVHWAFPHLLRWRKTLILSEDYFRSSVGKIRKKTNKENRERRLPLHNGISHELQPQTQRGEHVQVHTHSAGIHKGTWLGVSWHCPCSTHMPRLSTQIACSQHMRWTFLLSTIILHGLLRWYLMIFLDSDFKPRERDQFI